MAMGLLIACMPAWRAIRGHSPRSQDGAVPNYPSMRPTETRWPPQGFGAFPCLQLPQYTGTGSGPIVHERRAVSRVATYRPRLCDRLGARRDQLTQEVAGPACSHDVALELLSIEGTLRGVGRLVPASSQSKHVRERHVRVALEIEQRSVPSAISTASRASFSATSVLPRRARIRALASLHGICAVMSSSVARDLLSRVSSSASSPARPSLTRESKHGGPGGSKGVCPRAFEGLVPGSTLTLLGGDISRVPFDVSCGNDSTASMCVAPNSRATDLAYEMAAPATSKFPRRQDGTNVIALPAAVGEQGH
jgi:hypothetical protein